MKTNLIPEPAFTPIKIELVIETPREAAALIRWYDAISRDALRAAFDRLFQNDDKTRFFVDDAAATCLNLVSNIGSDIELSPSYPCVLEHLPRLPL